MPQFVMMLKHAPARYTEIDENEAMAIVKDYVAWVERMSADGIYVSGSKLAADGGKVLTRTDGGIEVHDGPYAELAEVLGGFMVIKCADMDAAMAIAKSGPHFTHNSTMQILPVDGMEDD